MANAGEGQILPEVRPLPTSPIQALGPLGPGAPYWTVRYSAQGPRASALYRTALSLHCPGRDSTGSPLVLWHRTGPYGTVPRDKGARTRVQYGARTKGEAKTAKGAKDYVGAVPCAHPTNLVSVES